MRELKEKKSVKLTQNETKDRNHVLKMLHESGDFDRLKNSAYAQLMLHPDGDAWREEVKQRTRDAIQQSNGGTDSIEEITLDELSETIVKHGVEIMPRSIQEDIMSRIRQAYRSRDQRGQDWL
mmetsp:Transcript_11974/g.34312  ORF Transcript_11974/g.34312 Transcript_11974/m.34312 type:complete len:123 (+) Transcript_11974:126-494(+)